MRRLVFPLITVLAAAALVPAWAAEGEGEGGKAAAPHDQAWVKQKVQTCASCHGPQGVSKSPMFPTIAGQYEDYVRHALTAYRDGSRQNAVMSGQAQGLTDGQIKALAKYFSEQQSPLHTPSLEE